MKKDKDGYGALLLSALKTSGLGVFEIAEKGRWIYRSFQLAVSLFRGTFCMVKA
jgi:hypothetical protein